MFHPPAHTPETPYPIHRPVVELSTTFDNYDDKNAPNLDEIFGMHIKDVLDKSYYDKTTRSSTSTNRHTSSKGSKSSGKRK